jgi:flagellar basal body rod protein FlgG
MNLVKDLNQYDDSYIIFCEPIKNNVMNDGNFIRILYSTNNFTLNGIYLFISLKDIVCDKYYNKYKCNFNVNNHKDLIEKIKLIEENILKKLENVFYNKFPQYKINEQLKNGYIKIFQEIQNKSNVSFILKISGVWEINSSFGLTYKFIKINDKTALSHCC